MSCNSELFTPLVAVFSGYLVGKFWSHYYATQEEEVVLCCDVNGHQCGEDPAVFRLMNGESVYILNDEEKVIVWHDQAPLRIKKLISIDLTMRTRAHPSGGLMLRVILEDGLVGTQKVSEFYDDFERDTFKEFLEENL